MSVVLESVIDRTVWSVSAGSWSSWSQIFYLQENQDLIENSKSIIWVINEGDFIKPTTWQSEYTHPTSRPLFGSIYLFHKYVKPKILKPSTSYSVKLSNSIDQINNTIRVLEAFDKECIVVFWPSKPSLVQDNERYEEISSRFREIKNPQIKFLDLKEEKLLDESDYKDSIHPVPKAVNKLSKFLKLNLEK